MSSWHSCQSPAPCNAIAPSAARASVSTWSVAARSRPLYASTAMTSMPMPSGSSAEASYGGSADPAPLQHSTTKTSKSGMSVGVVGCAEAPRPAVVHPGAAVGEVGRGAESEQLVGYNHVQLAVGHAGVVAVLMRVDGVPSAGSSLKSSQSSSVARRRADHLSNNMCSAG